MKNKIYKKIFITYGDKGYHYNLKRIRGEANKLNFFDKIITYSHSDLPICIKSSPLMLFSKGGGYWLWKPYLIWKTIQKYPNATVYYADAGCTLYENSNWEEYYQLSQKYDTIVFQYRDDYHYPWDDFGCIIPKIKYWSKQNTLFYFDNILKTSFWQETNIILGGFIITRNGSQLINDWLNISLTHPELIIDPSKIEQEHEPASFCQHRHDQSILTPLARYYEKLGSCLVLNEIIDSKQTTTPIRASRIGKIPSPIKTWLYHIVKGIIGDNLYHKLYK